MDLDSPLIVVVSGTYGVGKTSLAFSLSQRLRIKQSAGLGVISRVLSFIEKTNPTISDWGNYKDCKDEQGVIDKLHKEAAIAGGVISSIVEKAKLTGAPYIIDGVQLLPDYLPMNDILFIPLTLLDEVEHRKRFLTPDTTKVRHLDNVSFLNVRLIDREIVRSARQHAVEVINSQIPEDEIANHIIKTHNLYPT